MPRGHFPQEIPEEPRYETNTVELDEAQFDFLATL